MSFDLPLRCRCGHVHGTASAVSPKAGLRFVCYCTDCQAFARFLTPAPGRAASVLQKGHVPKQAPDVLDAAGGTDIFQMAAGRVKLTAGTDALQCISFSGKVLRWYADCCRTPIANTAASARFPMIALIHSFMDCEAARRSRDELAGLPLCRIYERSALGPLPANAPPPPSLATFARRTSKIVGWWAHGLGRPHPFFDDQTGAPLSLPRLLTRGGRTGQ